MNKIDIKGWKNFHLYDEHMFNIDMGNKFDKSKMDTTKNDINFIGRTGSNNGINATCGIYNNIEPYKSGLLTLALGGSVGSCFIQKKSFYTSQNVIVLIPKDNISDNVKQFIATVIQKESELHYKAFVKELNAHIKTDFVIPLPVNADNEPDWEYMESYMKNILQESEKNIENLRNIDNDKKKIDISKWQEYRLGDLFYKCNLDKKDNFNKISDVSLEKTDEFDLPLVNAKHYNNGIMYYGRSSDFDSEIMTLDIVKNGAAAVGDVYAQPQRTGVLEDAYLIKAYDNITSTNVLQFLATVIQKDIKQHFSYDNKCTWDKAKEMIIHLPAKPNGQPNWEYMENYMKNIMDDTKAKLNILKTAI